MKNRFPRNEENEIFGGATNTPTPNLEAETHSELSFLNLPNSARFCRKSCVESNCDHTPRAAPLTPAAFSQRNSRYSQKHKSSIVLQGIK